MTAQPTTHHLGTSGATLYYEVRGSGPLLLVVGQPMTSGPFAPLADALAVDRTVVTLDPRGVGRSTVEDRGQDVTPELEADDLAAIIEAVGAGPADVVGSSGGAVAGLELAARHPALVRVLVAHEPPVAELLPDAAHVRTVVDGITQAFLQHGPGAAWGAFVSLVRHDGPVGPDGVPPAQWPPAGAPPADPEPDAGDRADAGDPGAEPSPGSGRDDEIFFLRMLTPFTRYVPAVDALRDGAPRVVVAVGQASRQEVARRAAEALAERLGTEPVSFPGDHGGFMADPVAFADAVRTVLARVPA